MNMNIKDILPIIGALLFLSACSPSEITVVSTNPTLQDTSKTYPQSTATTEIVQTGSQTPEINFDPEPVNVPIPTNNRVNEGIEYNLPPQLIPFDGILPIYQPEFVPAGGAPLQEDELVMGVVLQGEAKAYPVSVLRFREMVDDELAGWPILMSW